MYIYIKSTDNTFTYKIHMHEQIYHKIYLMFYSIMMYQGERS